MIATKRREGQGGALKRDKDLRQAGSLREALTLKRRRVELSDGWPEAWERGMTVGADSWQGDAEPSDKRRINLSAGA
ncbi:hypothetical protein E9677_18580 [Rhizobium rhizophilum]|uniref:Uncharacterized protein n=1 Tax=Rhizobium rhizophilum TaxID=1850373 RepID=A0ABY2QS41_9HYPH|nr:hypothetical protein E9677_18580 [Rhizobium rhizophilum]